MPTLQCIKLGSKLRIRIISPGYLNEANCAFPRDLRVDGQLYECDDRDIRLVMSKYKYFYRISNQGIRLINDIPVESIPATPVVNMPVKVFTDISLDCSICLFEPKALIFIPCGHYSVCNLCDIRLSSRICPICRASIIGTVTPEQILN